MGDHMYELTRELDDPNNTLYILIQNIQVDDKKKVYWNVLLFHI